MDEDLDGWFFGLMCALVLYKFSCFLRLRFLNECGEKLFCSEIDCNENVLL